jgi:hypothetical protein
MELTKTQLADWVEIWSKFYGKMFIPEIRHIAGGEACDILEEDNEKAKEQILILLASK